MLGQCVYSFRSTNRHLLSPLLTTSHPSGVPLGGIGSGTIGRGFCGQFTRFQVRPGLYEYTTAAADQFIVTVSGPGGGGSYQQVLTSCGPPAGGQLSGWRWSFPGAEAEYRGLYPRAWTDYRLPGQDLKLTCRQISPVIPHNYKVLTGKCQLHNCNAWSDLLCSSRNVL